MADKRLEEGGEYVLEGNSVWITVRGVSVQLFLREDRLSYRVYPLGEEDGSPLVTTITTIGD